MGPINFEAFYYFFFVACNFSRAVLIAMLRYAETDQETTLAVIALQRRILLIKRH